MRAEKGNGQWMWWEAKQRLGATPALLGQHPALLLVLIGAASRSKSALPSGRGARSDVSEGPGTGAVSRVTPAVLRPRCRRRAPGCGRACLCTRCGRGL